jgi:hypothetical protein
MRSFFACECSGCRGYRVQFEDMRYNTARAVESLKGYYFSEGALRYFGAKITHYYPLENGGAVFYSTMKGGFEDCARVRTWVTYCPYGHLVEDLETDKRPPVNAKSLKAFEDLRKNGAFDSLNSFKCSCHGCQIDREGLREIEDAEICIDCPTHCGGE